jgi:hypothetical protein
MHATEAPPKPRAPGVPRWRRPLTLILGTLVGSWLVNGLTMRHYTRKLDNLPSPVFPKNRWVDAWVKWDAGWYNEIVNRGYSFTPGEQSSVAYFPGYPLLMRWFGAVVGNDFIAGIIITVASGIGYLLLVWRWCCDRLGSSAAWTALFLLVWYPYAFFLYGPIYSDAFFALCALAAFVLLERDRTVLAGLAGAAASATRPVGIAVIAGLLVLTLTRRNVVTRAPKLAITLSNLRAKDAGVLLAFVGVGSYLTYLGFRFGDPLIFLDAEAGWNQAPGWRTWFKVPFFEELLRGQSASWIWFRGMHLAAGITALALLPTVWKRFGIAYFVFAFIIIAIPLSSTKDFFSTGRYLLPAFPCFAAAGALLAPHKRLRAVVLGVSLAIMIGHLIAFGRSSYVS